MRKLSTLAVMIAVGLALAAILPGSSRTELRRCSIILWEPLYLRDHVYTRFVYYCQPTSRGPMALYLERNGRLVAQKVRANVAGIYLNYRCLRHGNPRGKWRSIGRLNRDGVFLSRTSVIVRIRC